MVKNSNHACELSTCTAAATAGDAVSTSYSQCSQQILRWCAQLHFVWLV